MRRPARILLTLCCAFALGAPSAALAQQPAPAVIDGSPLKILTTVDGAIQVGVNGAGNGEFFPSSTFDPVTSQPAPEPNTQAGFGIIIDPSGAQGGTRSYGRFVAGSMGVPDRGPGLTDPFTITTTWTLLGAGSGSGDVPTLRVTQTLHYEQGSRQAEASYDVTNLTGAPVTFRANIGGDLTIRGSDQGTGFLLGAAPNRFVGGLNQDVGGTGGFAEETPWTAYESGQLSTVRFHAGDGNSPGFDNTVSPDNVDNAAGVQWDDHYTNGLPAGQTATFNVALRFVDTLGLTPAQATEEIGAQHVVTATAGDLEGKSSQGQRLVYAVEGPNAIAGTVTTGAGGRADIAWVGGQTGTDRLVVFQDLNKNGVRDVSEPQATASVDWQGTVPPPEIGQSADVKEVSGTVKIKLPKGTSAVTAKRLGFHGAAASFQPLTGSAQIPVGSTLDTSRGTVQLLTAGSLPNSTAGPALGATTYQSGQFKNGLFTLAQSRKNPLVQLSMTGGNLGRCNTGLSRGGAAKAKRRRLFGNAHGRFRTRGRSSSATVRGTAWSMTDTCAGTLTAVTRGTVTVRDFTLRKNRTVKAGHRYFAKAPKKKRRHR